MSRPGGWARVWINIKKSLRGDGTKGIRKYIGEDCSGNRFYEVPHQSLSNVRRLFIYCHYCYTSSVYFYLHENVFRGYEPSPTSGAEPSLEWQSWLKGTRTSPPSLEQLSANRSAIANMNKRLEQEERDKEESPEFESEIINKTNKFELKQQQSVLSDKVKKYPVYKDFEYQPGVSNPANNKDSSDR
ncbi:unnamed protein product [Anisakis simplex]|uniref:Mimitin, mitochondrial n=1 Tax=Anisakis simplex TaxID=6269 RepID=A0A0M3K5K8_ANISI|nr:unnamed protein product [Anisakis simplex]